MRPEDPDDDGRIAAGVLRSIQLGGYDYPIRQLRRSGDTTCVTLPLQVRGFLALHAGDWLLFVAGSWPGLVVFSRVTAQQYELTEPDGREQFRKLARKVQARNSALFVNISPATREILSAEIGDYLIFGIAPGRGFVTLAAVKGGGDSAGSRRSG
jgi:hypothetical protein